MKRLILICILLFAVLPGAYGERSPLGLSEPEQAWLNAHKDETLLMGLDPYSGMEYFEYQNRTYGYVPELARLFEQELGIRIQLVTDKSWGEVMESLKNGGITMLFGANKTQERLKYMAFTEPVLKYPYAVFALKDSSVQTLGDLDTKRLGFIAEDFIQYKLPETYSQIRFTPVVYKDQFSGLNGLLNHEVDGFITSGGGVKHDFLFNYPLVAFIGEINAITSDMTISTLKENAILTGILDKVIKKHQKTAIDKAISMAEQTYNRKILRLTMNEVDWLERKGTAVVGLADDYLPFDYNENGAYKGISGAFLDRIHEITGIRFSVKKGSFNELYSQAVAGDVDILNLALTEDRLDYFIYPRPLSSERDIIVGRKSTNPVFDVYQLEGKRVAVIEGFWHEEYLRKNLHDLRIVTTKNIMESLKLVREGDADYLIENPTVVDYYINGLGYTDLVKKGTTSKDSFVYLGVTRKNPELASIIDKALVLIDYEEMKYKGIQTVPLVKNERNRQLGVVILLLAVILLCLGLLATYTAQQLIRQKAETQILKERAHLMYTDTLTGLFNRTYFNFIEAELENKEYPQTVIITDMNMLKRVNDSYGHHMGDALITKYVDLLRTNLPDALLFRMGGDEFLAFIPGCSSSQAEKLIFQLKASCADNFLTMADYSEIPLSAAFGYAVRPDAEERLDSVIIRADDHMYKDKKRQAGLSKDLGKSNLPE